MVSIRKLEASQPVGLYRCQHLPRLRSRNEIGVLDVRATCGYNIHTLILRRAYPRYQGPSEGYVVTITEPTRQGGIVSIYYFGTLLGCLMGGVLGDRQVISFAGAHVASCGS